MTKNLSLAVAFGAMVLFGATAVNAELIVIAPSQAAMVDQESEEARVAFSFPLEGLESGEHRRIDMAFLEWTVTGVSEATDAAFSAHPVTASWSAPGDGAAQVSVGEAIVAEWDITPADHERGNGGFVRLDVTSLVAAWASGAAANYGLVVTTGALSGESLAGQLGAARLIVYYGFGE